MTRGTYGQLTSFPESIKTISESILNELAASKQIQTVYIDFNFKNGVGSCLNYDIYGYDETSSLIVFQARQAFRERKRDYLQTHKTYALAGRNENGSPFWHPISSSIVHAAIKQDASPAHVVQKAIAWIFDVTLEKLSMIVRQGDVALVPARPRGTPLATNEAVLADTHILMATELRQDSDTLYAFNPSMQHAREQHAAVGAQGWHRVAVGREARAWDFSPRSVD